MKATVQHLTKRGALLPLPRESQQIVPLFPELLGVKTSEQEAKTTQTPFEDSNPAIAASGMTVPIKTCGPAKGMHVPLLRLPNFSCPYLSN